MPSKLNTPLRNKDMKVQIVITLLALAWFSLMLGLRKILNIGKFNLMDLAGIIGFIAVMIMIWL